VRRGAVEALWLVGAGGYFFSDQSTPAV